MKTITIIEGVTLTAAQSTIDAYEAERKAIDEETFFERQLDEALEEARTTGDPIAWGVFSDLYKSMYGIRPRWLYPKGA